MNGVDQLRVAAAHRKGVDLAKEIAERASTYELAVCVCSLVVVLKRYEKAGMLPAGALTELQLHFEKITADVPTPGVPR